MLVTRARVRLVCVEIMHVSPRLPHESSPALCWQISIKLIAARQPKCLLPRLPPQKKQRASSTRLQMSRCDILRNLDRELLTRIPGLPNLAVPQYSLLQRSLYVILPSIHLVKIQREYFHIPRTLVQNSHFSEVSLRRVRKHRPHL